MAVEETSAAPSIHAYVLVLLVAFILHKAWQLSTQVRQGGGGTDRGLQIRKPALSASVHCPFGAAEAQGMRPYMEDCCAAFGGGSSDGDGAADSSGGGRFSFFAVYDGHGGGSASEYCQTHMIRNIMQQTTFRAGRWEDAMKKAFLRTDASYLADVGDAGSTALVAMVRDQQIVVANAGDCRALLLQRGARAAAAPHHCVALSVDHKPNREDERARIEAAGGTVVFWGVWRVEGILAVSRAIGDKLLKQFVTAEPETRVWEREPSDAYLVLATDGVWDTISNQEAAEIVHQHAEGAGGSVEAAAEALVREAFRKGSADNISALVVDVGPK